MISRREFLQSAGALVVSFSMPLPAAAQVATPANKLSLYAGVDSWLAVASDGSVTVYCGKVELGTGVTTALSQIVAEELDVAFERISMVMADTSRCPDQGITAGSKTIALGGPQLRNAAAEARQALLGMAAARLNAPVEKLVVADGVVSVAGDAANKVAYGELIGGKRFERSVAKDVKVKSPGEYKVVGKSVRRVELPAKVAGTFEYMQNVRVPGMKHGRVVRPRSPGAKLVKVDEASVAKLPGNVRVVTKGDFVGVVAEREEQAIRAARELKITWEGGAPLPEMKALHESIRAAPAAEKVVVNTGDAAAAIAAAPKSLRASYQTPFQTHGSIGPSCAVAQVKDGQATVWSGTQGAFTLRAALSTLLGLPGEKVRVIFVEASGCYGHNGADDAAADAALLAQATGETVRVQWMRQDEHGWDPKGPAMLIDVRAGLDAGGSVVGWDYAVTTPTHSTRPSPAGDAGILLAGLLTGSPPKYSLTGGDRNANHTYVFKNDRVVVRWQASSALRPSAFRGLGSPQNTFANESFMDELAAAARADPVEYRLRHLQDARAIAVIDGVAKLAGWQARPAPRASGGGPVASGRGIAYAQYENENAYAAVVADVEVNRASGAVRVVRAYVAHDCGLIINPDGLKNQIEGSVVQTISRTLKEEIRFDSERGVTTRDWQSYPILRFVDLPDDIEIALINHPDKPPVGAGEPAASPVPAAIANAIFDATGARLRSYPFTPERVKAALG